MRKPPFTFSVYVVILILTRKRKDGGGMTEEEKKKQQYALVVKSNDLIRKSRFSLTLTEQRIVLYLISKIKPKDTELLEYDFDIREFCEVCGIDYYNNLSQLKETIKSLRDKSTWITLPDGGETLVSWIEKPYLYRNSGNLKIRLDRDMMPYLLQLKENFTKYELIAILALKSKFSLRLYELFKSYEYLGKYEVSLEQLRKTMMLETEYPKTNDFKRYVIDKALEEINTFTDLEIEYEVVKQGRFIVGFVFTIQKADNWDGEYHAAHLYLDGTIPSRHKQQQRFKEYWREHKHDVEEQSAAEESAHHQTSLFDDMGEV